MLKVEIKDEIFQLAVKSLCNFAVQFCDLDLKVKVKIKSQTFQFAINPERPILLKIAPYNKCMKLIKKIKFCDLETMIKNNNQMSNIVICNKS